MRGEDPELNPAQADTLARLGATAGERPQFDAELRFELQAALDHELSAVLDELPTEGGLFVSKYDLAQVHGCEARYVGTRDDFTWSVPLARGTISHKAIELTLNWRGEPVPATLVDEALAKLENEDAPVSDFLRTCSDADRAELRAQATERVAKFVECFPPLSNKWRPVVESRIRVDLAGGRLTLQGRTDLTLGRPVGTTAGKVIIDLKTGAYSPGHRDDLRFYALVETLRLGIPPRLVATYYLDTARADTEVVTEDLLEAATRRTIAGVSRLVALSADPSIAVKRTGPACRWCPLRPGCDEGIAFLAQRDDSTDAIADDPW